MCILAPQQTALSGQLPVQTSAGRGVSRLVTPSKRVLPNLQTLFIATDCLFFLGVSVSISKKHILAILLLLFTRVFITFLITEHNVIQLPSISHQETAESMPTWP